MFTYMTARVSTNTYCLAIGRGVSVDDQKTPLNVLLANARRHGYRTTSLNDYIRLRKKQTLRMYVSISYMCNY